MGAEKISILFDERVIAERVEELAKAIAADYQNDQLMIVPLLRGSFMFAADLIRALSGQNIRPRMDFMTLSSYGNARETSGTVLLTQDITERVQGMRVLVVDDILESGHTLSFAREQLLEKGALDVRFCVLLDKACKRQLPLDAHYAGFVLEDRFVVGYGLDDAGWHRELPFIGVVE